MRRTGRGSGSYQRGFQSFQGQEQAQGRGGYHSAKRFRTGSSDIEVLLDVFLEPGEIDRSHRVGPRRSNDSNQKPREIIVRPSDFPTAFQQHLPINNKPSKPDDNNKGREQSSVFVTNEQYEWFEAKRKCTLLTNERKFSVTTRLGWTNFSAKYLPWVEYLDVIKLSTEDIKNLSTYFWKLVRQIQHLPDRTANVASHLSLGRITIESEIHKRILKTFGNILCGEGNEDILHFIVKCSTLQHIRSNFLHLISEVLIENLGDQDIIQELMTSDEHLYQLVIDCSKYRFLNENAQERIETLSRGLCHRLFQQQAILIEQKPKV
ncbi:unnamed protein product [Mytilus coruscus]|uniref:Uncharacterized protein n=1 Tax=Mytilus coruscus TaxID=42192 RepID=A0A6J8D6I5_MYTCO|nr:unnamed protein product [Mytilus coruscus]